MTARWRVTLQVMGEPDKLIGVFDTEAEAEAVADAYWWEQDLALTITEVPA